MSPEIAKHALLKDLGKWNPAWAPFSYLIVLCPAHGVPLIQWSMCDEWPNALTTLNPDSRSTSGFVGQSADGLVPAWGRGWLAASPDEGHWKTVLRCTKASCPLDLKLGAEAVRLFQENLMALHRGDIEPMA